jgi:hypothetical protein
MMFENNFRKPVCTLHALGQHLVTRWGFAVSVVYLAGLGQRMVSGIRQVSGDKNLGVHAAHTLVEVVLRASTCMAASSMNS